MPPFEETFAVVACGLWPLPAGRGELMSLIEQLMVVSLVGILASIPIVTSRSDRDQLQLDASARRLQSGLARARSIARREQTACGVSLKRGGIHGSR